MYFVPSNDSNTPYLVIPQGGDSIYFPPQIYWYLYDSAAMQFVPYQNLTLPNGPTCDLYNIEYIEPSASVNNHPLLVLWCNGVVVIDLWLGNFKFLPWNDGDIAGFAVCQKTTGQLYGWTESYPSEQDLSFLNLTNWDLSTGKVVGVGVDFTTNIYNPLELICPGASVYTVGMDRLSITTYLSMWNLASFVNMSVITPPENMLTLPDNPESSGGSMLLPDSELFMVSTNRDTDGLPCIAAYLLSIMDGAMPSVLYYLPCGQTGLNNTEVVQSIVIDGTTTVVAALNPIGLAVFNAQNPILLNAIQTVESIPANLEIQSMVAVPMLAKGVFPFDMILNIPLGDSTLLIPFVM